MREKKRNRGELCDREKERDPRGEKKREKKKVGATKMFGFFVEF